MKEIITRQFKILGKRDNVKAERSNEAYEVSSIFFYGSGTSRLIQCLKYNLDLFRYYVLHRVL